MNSNSIFIKENYLLNSQIFNSNNNNNNNNNYTTTNNNNNDNTIRNNNENEIANGNQYNISSQSTLKQEILIRNSQVSISGSQNNNYRRTRQNSINNRYPNSSYKRSNTQSSKCKLN